MTSKKDYRAAIAGLEAKVAAMWESFDRENKARDGELVNARRERDALKAENERLRAELAAHTDKQARTWPMLPPQTWPMPYGPYWSILPQQAGFPE